MAIFRLDLDTLFGRSKAVGGTKSIAKNQRSYSARDQYTLYGVGYGIYTPAVLPRYVVGKLASASLNLFESIALSIRTSKETLNEAIHHYC